MAAISSINIRFTADLKQFSDKMQNANRSVQKMGKRLTNVGKGLSVGLTAPLVAFSAVALKNWDKQEKAIAQVENGLRTTGDAVGYTSTELQKMASDLQKTSLFGDEDILQGVTTQLLTFTNIAGEQFKRTQLAALDLSAKLGTDLKSSSIQLGKALNDPVANLSALSRSGIQFSTEQKTVIKSLVETNRLADAQTIILDELAKQYGGSAEAAAKAGLGPFKQLSNIIGDLTEDFGKIIGQALLPFVEKIKTMVSGFQNLSPATKKFIVIIGSLVAALGPLLIALGFLMTTVIPGLITAFTALTAAAIANPFGALAIAVTAVVSAFYLFGSSVDNAYDKQRTLNAVMDVAAKSTANAKAKLAALLVVAKDETQTKVDRVNAIKKINEISPKYLGDIDLDALKTGKAKKAIDAYNNSLLETAKIKAAQDFLVNNQAKLIQAEIEHAKVQKKLASEFAQQWSDKEAGVVRVGNITEETIKTELENSKALISSLKEEGAELLKIIASNKLKNKVVNKVVPPKKVGRAKATDILGDKRNDEGKIKQNLDFDITTGILNQKEVLNTSLSEMTEDLSGFQAAAFDIGSSVGDAFSQMSGSLVDSFGLANDGFEGFVGGLFSTVTKLISMYLAQSIASAIAGASASGAATGPAAIFTTPAFIATAIGGVVSAFAAIPKFATGGIVGGHSPIGDKLLARVNSGEMILNNRQQRNLSNMISPANQSLEVVLGGQLTADAGKLQFVLDKYNSKKQRRK